LLSLLALEEEPKEIARCKLRDGLEIKAIKVKDLLEDIGLKRPKLTENQRLF
jgi:hypothetical protein